MRCAIGLSTRQHLQCLSDPLEPLTVLRFGEQRHQVIAPAVIAAELIEVLKGVLGCTFVVIVGKQE